ncbi:MAG TPA: nucleotidyltransferase family protein [Bacteroidales bacterium]|nr:nucleotidyltransferase family protein [Bacteroidales bacterium]
MKAMILAAGKGARLGKITEKIPKALVDINGKTILQLAVEKCTGAGFGEIIVNVHHLADIVEKEILRLNKSGYSIIVSDERENLLETGGGLFNARHFFDDEPFLLYNVDIITDFDLSAMLEYHLKMKGMATLAVRNREGNRFFLVNGNGLLHGWCNRSTGERIIARDSGNKLEEIAFSGVHIINPEIFNFMEEGTYSLTSLYLKLAQDLNIYTYRHEQGYWFDIGTPESLKQVKRIFSDKRRK